MHILGSIYKPFTSLGEIPNNQPGTILKYVRKVKVNF
jgi:hypothetical protein